MAQEANDSNQGRLKLKLVKANFDEKEKQKPFSDAEFEARIDKMVNKRKLERDGNKIAL